MDRGEGLADPASRALEVFASLGLAALDFLGWVMVGPHGRVLLLPPGFGGGLWAEKQPRAEISRAQKHCHLLTCPGTLAGPGRAAGHHFQREQELCRMSAAPSLG